MVVMPAMRLVRCPGWCAVVQRCASAVAQGISDTLFVTEFLLLLIDVLVNGIVEVYELL